MGAYGELVITTFRKEGAPLLRYRTHDITRFVPGPCACGSVHPRHDRIIGRTDDMVKVKGVNIYPGQIDEVLKNVEGVSSEYLTTVDHQDGKDCISLAFEILSGVDTYDVEAEVKRQFKSRVGLSIIPIAGPIGSLPRSEKKSVRIIDRRFS